MRGLSSREDREEKNLANIKKMNEFDGIQHYEYLDAFHHTNSQVKGRGAEMR